MKLAYDAKRPRSPRHSAVTHLVTRSVLTSSPSPSPSTAHTYAAVCRGRRRAARPAGAGGGLAVVPPVVPADRRPARGYYDSATFRSEPRSASPRTGHPPVPDPPSAASPAGGDHSPARRGLPRRNTPNCPTGHAPGDRSAENPPHRPPGAAPYPAPPKHPIKSSGHPDIFFPEAKSPHPGPLPGGEEIRRPPALRRPRRAGRCATGGLCRRAHGAACGSNGIACRLVELAYGQGTTSPWPLRCSAACDRTRATSAALMRPSVNTSSR